MSRTYSKLSNKHHKHPKVYFQQYLNNFSEPQEYINSGSLADFEIELIENSELVRQSFRNHARRIRDR